MVCTWLNGLFSAISELHMKQWKHSLKQRDGSTGQPVRWLCQLTQGCAGRPGLRLLSCEAKGWALSVTLHQGVPAAQLIKICAAPFVQRATGRRGLRKRNILGVALSEMQTQSPKFKLLPLNEDWIRGRTNKRENHFCGREARCKAFWRNKAVSEIVMRDQTNPPIKRPQNAKRIQ